MLHQDILSATKIAVAIKVEDVLGSNEPPAHAEDNPQQSKEDDSGWYNGPAVSSFFELARHPGMVTFINLSYLSILMNHQLRPVTSMLLQPS
jgi:hypothetical protein